MYISVPNMYQNITYTYFIYNLPEVYLNEYLQGRVRNVLYKVFTQEDSFMFFQGKVLQNLQQNNIVFSSITFQFLQALIHDARLNILPHIYKQTYLNKNLNHALIVENLLKISYVYHYLSKKDVIVYIAANINSTVDTSK